MACPLYSSDRMAPPPLPPPHARCTHQGGQMHMRVDDDVTPPQELSGLRHHTADWTCSRLYCNSTTEARVHF